MSSEEAAFQARLDECPDDHDCRRVFGDWLEGREDVRAEGYRALGAKRVVPSSCDPGLTPGWDVVEWQYWLDTALSPSSDGLPSDWFGLIEKLPPEQGLHYRTRPGRRQLDDAAATAFAALPPERRMELLNATVTA
jgi:uncharacterized protein (TIGR02996 family)